MYPCQLLGTYLSTYVQCVFVYLSAVARNSNFLSLIIPSPPWKPGRILSFSPRFWFRNFGTLLNF